MNNIILLAIIEVISLVYGQTSELDNETDYSELGITPEQRKAVEIFGKLDSLVKYCYEHASSSLTVFILF